MSTCPSAGRSVRTEGKHRLLHVRFDYPVRRLQVRHRHLLLHRDQGTHGGRHFVTYFKAGSTFVVQKGNPNKVDSSNLCGVKVAVQTGTTQEEEVNKANEQCKADGKDAIDIQSSKLQTDVTTAVASGKADIFYADTPVAGYAIKQTGDTLEALGEDVGVTPEAVAVKKGDSKTAEAVQKAIQKLMDDGTYKKILDTWGVSSGAVDKAEINPSVE